PATSPSNTAPPPRASPPPRATSAWSALALPPRTSRSSRSRGFCARKTWSLIRRRTPPMRHQSAIQLRQRHGMTLVELSVGSAIPAASAFLWKGDDWNGSADGQVQVGELALIEHDAAAQRIYLYQAKPFASMTLDQQIRAATVFNWSTLSSNSTPPDFKNLD